MLYLASLPLLPHAHRRTTVRFLATLTIIGLHCRPATYGIRHTGTALFPAFSILVGKDVHTAAHTSSMRPRHASSRIDSGLALALRGAANPALIGYDRRSTPPAMDRGPWRGGFPGRCPRTIPQAKASRHSSHSYLGAAKLPVRPPLHLLRGTGPEDSILDTLPFHRSKTASHRPPFRHGS